MAITDAWLRAYSKKVLDTIIEKTDRDGLSARVSKKGKVVFQLRFRFDGKQQRVDVGVYPLISLKKAREEALRFKAELALGHDPRIVKKLDLMSNREAVLFRSVFEQWYQAYAVHKKQNHIEIYRTFELYVLPELGDLPLDKITADRWLTLMEGVAKKYSSIADRILTNTKQMLSWAVRRRLIDHNCLSDINAKQDLNVVSGVSTRVLDDDEIRMLYVALDGSRIAPKNRLFLELCLIYGCRNGELRVSKKRDFDFDKMIWTVPPESHKMGKTTGKPLIRPVTDKTAELLEESFNLSVGSDYAFSNARSIDPMGRNSPGSLPYNLMQWLRKNKNYEMVHWSLHDLRRTARTNFSTITQPHIAEIMLGHKLPGEWMTYDKYDYLDEQCACLNGWVDRLNKIIGKF